MCIRDRDRIPHGKKLVQEISAVEADSESEKANTEFEEKPAGITLDFISDPGFKLYLDGLEQRRSKIELRNSRIDGDVMHATVFVPDGKIGLFVRKFESYTIENTKKGKPKNQKLAESIGAIRRATLESFWTDAGQLPDDGNTQYLSLIHISEPTRPERISYAVF